LTAEQGIEPTAGKHAISERDNVKRNLPRNRDENAPSHCTATRVKVHTTKEGCVALNHQIIWDAVDSIQVTTEGRTLRIPPR
jgi:hypothetical protein